MSAERWSSNALVAVFGATGTGKSKLAVALAKRFGGEVINADAVQLYEGLPIVTNKISSEEMSGVKHHLLGNISLSAPPWTVGQYVANASKAIEDIKQRGKLPILVGGTHYYTQSLLFQDQTVKNAHGEYLEKEEKADRWPILKGTDSQILEKLKEVDPDMAARWHPNDSRRIRRSLEIWLQTGRKASEIYAEQKERAASLESGNQPGTDGEKQESLLRYDTLAFWTHAKEDELKERLNQRVDTMVRDGLLDEVKHMRTVYNNLVAEGDEFDVSTGVWIAIGYKEFLEYLELLESGTATDTQLAASLANGIEKTKTATRQYAKKQGRWIRIKLFPTLQKASAEPRIFPLNATEVGEWTAAVESPALRITEAFLARQPLTNSLLPDADLLESLQGPEKQVEERLPVVKTCELCGVVMTTVTAESLHMKSRKHKANLRKTYRNNHKPH